MIEILYSDYIQTEEYTKAADKMKRKECVKAARDMFIEPIYEKDFKDGSNAEGIFLGATSAIEQFGFEQGFKYAMRLRDECNISL